MIAIFEGGGGGGWVSTVLKYPNHKNKKELLVKMHGQTICSETEAMSTCRRLIPQHCPDPVETTWIDAGIQQLPVGSCGARATDEPT